MPRLPEQLMESLSRLDHFDEAAFRAVHESGRRVLSLRFNPAKRPLAADGSVDLTLSFPQSGPVPWSTEGYYLPERPSFTLDPLFHAGAYYVQEASGMFLEQAVRHTVDLSGPLKVLDLCAAPGGKSTLLQSLINRDSVLLSNEVIKTRVPVLHQNLSRWGWMNGLVSCNDPKDFKRLPGYFDLLFIDAPCSGSGLFRRDPQTIATWSADLVRLCSQRQQRILADAWDCLREDGVLIYSTCSFSPEENEDVLDHLLLAGEAESLRIPINPSWKIVETLTEKGRGHGYRFYPDKLDGEGFFLAAVRKKSCTAPPGKRKVKWDSPGKREEAALKNYLPDPGLQFVRMEEWIHAMPGTMMDAFSQIKQVLYLKKAGTMAGKMGSDEWIPDHELALSTALDPAVPDITLSRSEAVKYLRKEAPTVTGQRRGWQTVSFGGQRLGWVKILPNRLNNYYPQAWRILK